MTSNKFGAGVGDGRARKLKKHTEAVEEITTDNDHITSEMSQTVDDLDSYRKVLVVNFNNNLFTIT